MERAQTVYRSAPTPPEILSAETVEDSDLRDLLDYWNRLRGGRAMPTRGEIAPKDIRRSLRYIHIYDVLGAAEDFRARLVGTAVYPGLDQDQTGKLVSEHPDPGIRLRFAVLLRHVTATVAPARSVSLRITGSAHTDARTEGIWLPLGEDRTVQQIMVQTSFRPIAA